MLSVFFRTVFLYLVLMVVIRLLGKRQLGQMEPSEVVVTMVVADLAAYPMQDENIPLLVGLIPIGAVLTMELLLSRLSMRSIRLRKLLCGKPVILIENGKLLYENLRKTRVTLDELSSQLREKDILDPALVQYAILETGGNLSVFPFPEECPVTAKQAGIPVQKQYMPITVISDGQVISDNLKKAGRDQRWLQKTLSDRHATVQTTLLLTVDHGGCVRFFPKNETQ